MTKFKVGDKVKIDLVELYEMPECVYDFEYIEKHQDKVFKIQEICDYGDYMKEALIELDDPNIRNLFCGTELIKVEG